MHNFKEGDSVRLLAGREADVIGESRKLRLPAGSLASVVLVYGDARNPEAYELEAHVIEQDCYVLLTVVTSEVGPA